MIEGRSTVIWTVDNHEFGMGVKGSRDDLAGVRGVALPWVRTISVRLLRMLYGRE